MKYPEQESSILEFKKELPKSEQILKTVIGFCNHKGGRLIVGVDNDGLIVGVSEDKIQQLLEYMEQSVFQATHPTIIPLVYTQKIGKFSLLIIEVFPGSNKPYFLKSEGAAKGVYIRLGRSTLRATPEIIQELGWQARGKSLDQIPVYQATFQDLDEKKIRDFLKHKKVPITSKIALEKILCDYHCAVYEQTKLYPTLAGMLLFGKNPQHFFPQSYTVCTHFSGTSLAEAKSLATRDFTGTIFEQFDDAYDFVLQRLSRSFQIKGSRRVDTPELPQEAVREVLINAFAHRNYHLSSPIKIAIFTDRIEVYSPGDFPGPLTNQNLLMGLSFIRNDAICKALKEVGVIEAFGIGFSKLFESYKAMGLAKPTVIEGENYIKCILPRQTSDFPLRSTLDEDEEVILKLFHTATAITTKDLVQYLHFARVTAGRKLKNLVEKKVIRKKGYGRKTHYVLASPKGNT